MRRKERQISEQQALQIVENCDYAVFATADAQSSRPYCIPVSPVLFDGALYFHCALEGQKTDNLLANPHICLTCVGQNRLEPEHFTTKYKSAVVFGLAEMVEEDSEKIDALRALCEKYAASNMQNFDKVIAASLPRTAICKITIESITGKSNDR